MRTNNSNTERRLAEADAGSQQLLEKLLEVEKDVEGKVRDNASSVQNQLINLDAENKNNAQMLVTLQESINIQVQDTKKVDAERQRSEAKAKEDLDANAAARTNSERSTVRSRVCTRLWPYLKAAMWRQQKASRK